MKYPLYGKEKYLIKVALFNLLSEINDESGGEYELLADEVMLPIVREFTQGFGVEEMTKVYEQDKAMFVKDAIALIKKLK